MTRQSSDKTLVRVQDSNVDAFGQRLGVAIKRAGGATNMAKKAGVSTSVLSKWRTGKSEPSRTNLINMARAADVTVQWLVEGEGEPEDASTSTPITDSVIELDLVEQVVSGLEARYEARGVHLSPEAKGKIVRLVLEYLHREGKPSSKASLDNIIELAAFRTGS